MADTGYVTQTEHIVTKHPELVTTFEKNVETVAGMYPGYIVKAGSTEYDIALADGIALPTGILGYEQTAEVYRKESKTTIYVAEDKAKIIRGSGFSADLFCPIGVTIAQGDLLMTWEDGVVVPVEMIDGKPAIRIPFTKNASETDTSLNLPSGVTVTDVAIEVTTAAGSSTIDVGLLSTESGGDADGFADGVSCAAATTLRPGPTVTTGSSEVYISASTRGVLLVDTFTAGTDNATDVGTYEEKIHVGDGTAESISYTTSSHTVAGNIFLVCNGPGLKIIGTAGKAVDNSAGSAAAIVPVEVDWS